MRKLPFALALLAPMLAAQDLPAFRADVSLVHLDTEVLSKTGQPVTGLSKSDFRVFDEGMEQILVGFASEEQPLDIILLFDISSSMRSKVQKFTAVTSQALHELKEGDRVSVMTFNDRTQFVLPFTTDLPAVEHDVQTILTSRFRGLTYIQQALDDAARYFLRNPRTARRRAILVITDNLGVRARSQISIVRTLWEADAVVCGLIIPDPAYPARRAIVAVLAPWVLAKVGGMERIAEQTGGDTVRAEDAASAFPEVMRRIRNRYSLYYSTPEGKTGSPRSVRVELAPDALRRNSEARVSTRRGYVLTR